MPNGKWGKVQELGAGEITPPAGVFEEVWRPTENS